MQENKIYKVYEEFDRTRAFPWTKKRVNFSLSVNTINKIKMLSKKNNMNMSKLIETKFK
jgi:hypothetical protein